MFNPPVVTGAEVTDKGLVEQYDPVICDLSIVVPIHNEEENVEPPVAESKEVLSILYSQVI